MKKSFFIILVIAFVLLFNQHQVFAIVSADGWMEWDLPASAQFGPIGNIAANAYQSNGNAIINNTYVYTYDNVTPHSLNNITDGFSTISGSINPQTNRISGQISAISMNQGDMNYAGHTSFGGGQYIYYNGVLPSLDYTYFFHGQNDSLRDNLGFFVQIAARYSVYDNFGNFDHEVIVYSDYRGVSLIPNYFIVTNNTDPVQFTGDFHSADLSSYGSQNWFIEYDFGFYASDTVDSNSTIPAPEPTTMFLLGLGLVGLAGAKRKFQK
jgi:hypothetical protein